jgi:defect in organelle trafficking protein DotD
MKKIFILLFAVLISGCSSSTQEVAYIKNDNVSVQLTIAAQKASNAILELAEVEKVRTPTTAAPIIEDAPRLLRQPMSIKWNGPIGPMAEKIAERAMYGFAEFGNGSTIPVLVQVDAVETPLVDILKNIGLQAGARANIIIDVENRNIEVHYVEVQETL